MKIEIYGGVILTYNELMMKSLSDLLQDGEKLLYPIYGTLKQKKNNFEYP